jgi:4-alpha-glucanotransferase
MPHGIRACTGLGAHDLPTLVGFWENIEARHKAGLLGDESSYQAQLSDRAEEKQKLLDLFHRLRLLPDWFAKRASDIPAFTGELHYAAVGFLASTPSELMVLNQEDLFKDPEQQNLPGTTEQYPNWRHKMRYNIEECVRILTRATALDVSKWQERTERLNQPT